MEPIITFAGPALLIFSLLGPAPTNDAGVVTGPSTVVARASISFPDQTACEDAVNRMTASWSRDFNVVLVPRECVPEDPANR